MGEELEDGVDLGGEFSKKVNDARWEGGKVSEEKVERRTRGGRRSLDKPSWRDDESSDFVLFERKRSSEDLLDDGDDEGEGLSRSGDGLRGGEGGRGRRGSRSAWFLEALPSRFAVCLPLPRRPYSP